LFTFFSLNVNFHKLLADLYGLNAAKGDRMIIIDKHRKLAYRGELPQNFGDLLTNIIVGNNSKIVHTFDNNFRNRIKLAAYEKEWNKFKAFGYVEMKTNKTILNVEAFLKV
jgi:hypothetical protein